MGRLKGKEREIAAALLGISVAIILWLTIFRRESVVEDSFAYHPFHSLLSLWSSVRKQGIRGNFVGNILIFTPVGFLYPITFCEDTKKTRQTIIFGLCLSLLVEFTQLVFSKGYFDLDDIILNTVGTLIGCLFYRIALYRLKNR